MDWLIFRVQPKRRRSSAQPALGEPPRKLLIEPQPLLKEESEPEEDLPVRKIGRKAKNVRLLANIP